MPANLISVPSLHSELLQSTALTPTYHKSRGLSMVISVVVGLAVPGIGGALAGALEISSSIGIALTTAAVGAAAGAGVAYAGGGDPLYGAIAGGAGGFISGGGPGALYDLATANIGGSGGGLGPGAVPAPDGSMLAGGGQNVQVASLGGKGSFPLSGTQPAPVVDANIISEASRVGLTPSEFLLERQGFVVGDEMGLTGMEYRNPTGTLANPSVVNANFSRSPPPVISDREWRNNILRQVPDIPPGRADTSSLEPYQSLIGGGSIPDTPSNRAGYPGPDPDAGVGWGLPAASTEAAKEPWKFSDLLPTGKDIAGGVVGGLRDLMVHGLTEAGQQPPPQTREEAGLREGRDRALEAQLRLQGKKEGISDRFMAQARTISPLQRGQQQFALAQERLGRAQQAGLRRLGTGQTGAREAMIRRNALDRSRLGSEFPRGYQSGQRDVERLMTQGLAALPTGSPMYTSAAGALAAADRGYARQYQEDQNRATWLSGIMGVPGVLSKEEREKRRRQAEGLK